MSTVIQERLDAITGRALGKGSHESIERGLCVMEAVAYVAGEDWTDRPQCASPTIAAFMRSWNDSLPDDETRTRLLAPLIPRLVGTASDEATELRRSYLALDWMVRVMTPAWLELAGLTDHAGLLRDMVEICDTASAEAAKLRLDAARAAAGAAAGAAARAAAWDAAGAAARAAAGAAAGAAARAAAWAAAGAAARAAARAAAWDAAGAAAWDAAGDAARAAAWDAAGAAAWDAAGAAAWDAAGDALKPTVDTLQTSALELIDRMIDLGEAT